MLFAIELGSRRVHVLGATRNPDSAWVSQQARNLAVGEGLGRSPVPRPGPGFQVHGPFDEVFHSEGREGHRDPDPGSTGERVRRTVGLHGAAECLDWTLVLGRRHLEWVLRTFASHYTADGPTEPLSSRRRTRGLIRLPGRPTAHAFERAPYWAGLSMSTISLLEVGSEFVCPSRSARGLRARLMRSATQSRPSTRPPA